MPLTVCGLDSLAWQTQWLPLTAPHPTQHQDQSALPVLCMFIHLSPSSLDNALPLWRRARLWNRQIWVWSRCSTTSGKLWNLSEPMFSYAWCQDRHRTPQGCVGVTPHLPHAWHVDTGQNSMGSDAGLFKPKRLQQFPDWPLCLFP